MDLPLSLSQPSPGTCLLPGRSVENGFCPRSWPGILIKNGVLKCTQADSDKVLANVGGAGFFFFLKSQFIKVTFTIYYIEKNKLELLWCLYQDLIVSFGEIFLIALSSCAC